MECHCRCAITGTTGIYSDPRHVILYTSNGEVQREFSIVLTGAPSPDRGTPSGDYRSPRTRRAAISGRRQAGSRPGGPPVYAPVGLRRAVRNNWASSRVVVASSAALSSRHRPVNRGKRMASPASSSIWPQAAV
jgi:hypothetical protein